MLSLFFLQRSAHMAYYRRRQPAYQRRRSYAAPRRSVRSRAPRRRASYSRRSTRTTRRRNLSNNEGKDWQDFLTQRMTRSALGDKYIMSQANPWDENVDGVKIPDANTQPSVPLKAEDTFDVNVTGVQTCRCTGINPSLTKTFYGGAGASATTWTWSAAYAGAVDSAKLTQLRSDFELFRPVAHAVRITSGLAPTAAIGFVHVCVFTMATFGQTTWPCPTSISEMQQVPGYKRYPIGRLTAEGLVVVNRPLDCTSQRYIDTDSDIYGSSGTNEFNVPFQWGTILVAVSGVGVSVPISIENIVHLECIPRATSISQSTPAAQYDQQAIAGASNAQSRTQAAALDSEVPGRTRAAVGHAAQAVGAGMYPRLTRAQYDTMNIPRGAPPREWNWGVNANGIRNTVRGTNEGML